MTDPFDLSSHDYDDVLRRYDRSREWQAYAGSWISRAHALLCIGNLDGAMQSLRTAERMSASQKFVDDPSHPLIGVIDYLQARSLDAIAFFRERAEGVESRRIGYTDAAGGVGYGLRLWYVARRAGDVANEKYAIKYLKGRLKRKIALMNMPGPIALHLLGNLDAEGLLMKACGTSDWAEIKKLEKIYLREFATISLFYIAFKQELDGQIDKSRATFQRCASLENLHGYVEWYLARRESGLDFWWRPMN